MRLATQLGYGGGIEKTADRIVEFERAGLDIVWVAEAYGFDAPTQMGYLAAVTERVEIGSGILPLYSRTPTLLAQTAAGLDAVSGGRAILGLGASGPQVIEGWHGVAYDRPVQRTRETIDICRRVWRREVLVHDGAYTFPLREGEGRGLGKPLKLLAQPVRERIPIYVAAIGTGNVEMTAELADGWLPAFFLPEKAEEIWGDALAAGAARRDPALGPLEVAAGGPAIIGEGVEHLRDIARNNFALYIGGMGARTKNFYNELACQYGFAAEAKQIQDLYLDGKKEEAVAAVPADLLEKTSLIGSEGYVKERLAAFAEAGVTVLNITPLGPDPVNTVERIKTLIS